MHYLLFYEVADDYLERRGKFRKEHLELAWQYHSQGKLVLGGAIQEPVDTAILLFKGDSPSVAESFVEKDPYVKNGLIKIWSVRPWITVVGDLAESPIKIEEL